MEFTIHVQVLLSVFLAALIMGAVMSKTNFCTMGAVSDWVNMGDMGRMRSWLFAIAAAITGVLLLEGMSVVTLGRDTLPPYRTENFAWLRYILGGTLFGIGMTLASGCPTRTLVRLGGGNLKSLVVAALIGAVAYLMFTTPLFEASIMSWLRPTVVDLSRFQIQDQGIGAIVGGVAGLDPFRTQLVLGAAIALALLWFVFKSKDFRGSFDHVLGGAVVGLAVVTGWYITGGSMGAEWKEYAMFAEQRPSRVDAQSFTFISPMGDTVRYLIEPARLALVSFGVASVFGVVLGSLLYAVASRRLRIEWFVSFQDFLNHAVGGVLMGFGGFMAMGCTIGQGVSGVSTLALGSFMAFAFMVLGSALAMKVQYYMLDERGFWHALRAG